MDRFSQNLIHTNIMLVCGDCFDFLKIETHSEFIDRGHLPEQAVVIAFSAS